MILLGNTLMNVLQECVTISMFCSSACIFPCLLVLGYYSFGKFAKDDAHIGGDRL